MIKGLLAALAVLAFAPGLPRAQEPEEEAAPRPPAAAAEEAAQEPDAPPAKTFDPLGSDQEAIELVEQLWETLGGKEAYERIDFIRFTFKVQAGEAVRSTRSLLWDRRAQRLRVFLKTMRGELVVLIDLNTRGGVALENGAPVPEEDMAGVVAYAYDNFWLNDVHWLIAPWRLKDPGVHLRMAGEVVDDAGKTLKKIAVTFDEGAAQGPGSAYWLLIDPDSGLLREWAWRLPGMPEEQEPLRFAWEEWVERSGVKFSTVKTQVGGDQRVLCDDLETPAEIPGDSFAGL
ncbi:MAG: hypothetical protein HY812_07795 [Planctomycetes bacterium]|nr:hypothetical protein [Planctomycetota bacterium]